MSDAPLDANAHVAHFLGTNLLDDGGALQVAEANHLLVQALGRVERARLLYQLNRTEPPQQITTRLVCDIPQPRVHWELPIMRTMMCKAITKELKVTCFVTRNRELLDTEGEGRVESGGEEERRGWVRKLTRARFPQQV